MRKCGLCGFAVGPINGDVGPALVWQDQNQVPSPVLAKAPQHDKRLALKGMMWASDGYNFGKVVVVGSMWWFPLGPWTMRYFSRWYPSK